MSCKDKEDEEAIIEWREYNGFNQLIKVNRPPLRVSYCYRPDGLRHNKSVSNSSSGTSKTIVHHWDGQNIVQETVNGKVQNKYLRGINLVALQDGGELRYYLFNLHGDVVRLTDKSGAVVKEYEYDAFGSQQRNGNDKEDINPFKYCGEYTDLETNTIYLRNRYYIPATGRFSAEDPTQAGLNWYTYCQNNPIMFTDPLGLMTEDEIKEVMKKYEDDGMAPMAYSYSMELIYAWYLADTNKAKAGIDNQFYAFRDTGYTTTNGARSDVDKGIAFMPTKPGADMTQEQHYFRNKLNLDFSWSEMEKFKEVLPDFLQWNYGVAASLHQNVREVDAIGNKIDNIKIVSADGYFEEVFSGVTHKLQTATNSSLDMGTYNYASPANNGWGHYWLDVRTYNGYQNTKSDFYKFYKQYYDTYGNWPE